MEPTLKILAIEDNPADFILVERHLRQQGMDAECLRVDSSEALDMAINDFEYDLVLSDFSVPSLDFYDTFAMLQSRLPDLPVILVSGSVGEEQAVELLKLGVCDFILKDNLTRLVPAIKRSLKEFSVIRARRSAEQSLLESESRFRELFEYSPVAYQSLDESGCFLDVNSRMVELLGYSREQLTGTSFSWLWTTGTRPYFEEKFATFKQEGRVRAELELIRKDGELITVLLEGRVQRDSNGRIMRTHCVLYDISERRNLEEQLRQSQKMEAVGQLAGGVAHDFNNIMQVILGNAQLQLMFNRRHDLDCRYVDEIFKAVERGASLTRSLLVFSRRQPLELTCFDLNGLVKESRNLAVRLVTEEISLNLELYDHELNIKGDAGLVQQVIFNLVTNARDAISRQGVITIGTKCVVIDKEFISRHGSDSPEGNYAVLSVKDSGCGISEEIMGRIFEPFFTTKEAGKGTGLGLAMIYGTIHQMDGFIIVDSRSGEGTSFEIYIPLARKNGVSTAASPGTGNNFGNDELLLLVEDEDGVRDSLSQILTISGYRVICAANAVEAIGLVTENSSEVQLAIMDMILPGMNGMEAAGELHRISPDLPVLFLSGYSEETLESKGITGYHLQKPVHPLQLLGQIRRLLDESRVN